LDNLTAAKRIEFPVIIPNTMSVEVIIEYERDKPIGKKEKREEIDKKEIQKVREKTKFIIYNV
jgi:hypothetical protein